MKLNSISIRRFVLARNYSSSIPVFSRRSIEGPWLSRELLPNKSPVLVIDFKDINYHDSSVESSSPSSSSSSEHEDRDGIISKYRQLASFNWAGTPDRPILIIPGAPRRFRKSWMGGELRRDTDSGLVSKHMFMTPNYPMESMFLAAMKCADLENRARPRFNDFDVATDRAVLRRLFEFCRRRGFYPRSSFTSNLPRVNEDGLRLDVERAGDRLVIFNRREPSVFSSQKERWASFGHDFYSKITDSAPMFVDSPSNPLMQILNETSRSSSSSNNILETNIFVISYVFGRFKMLVRHSVSCADMDFSQPIETSSAMSDSEDYRIHQIPDSEISCIYAGQRHIYHTVEVTSRNAYRPFPRYKWLQLYFAQTPSVVIGWHHLLEKPNKTRSPISHAVPKLYTREEFNVITEHNVARLDDEGFDQRTLYIMHNLIDRIVDFVRCQPVGKKFAIIWSTSRAELQVFEKSSASSSGLPDYLLNEID